MIGSNLISPPNCIGSLSGDRSGLLSPRVISSTVGSSPTRCTRARQLVADTTRLLSEQEKSSPWVRIPPSAPNNKKMSITSNTVRRLLRIERVLRQRYGIRRTDMQMYYCRMKDGSLSVLMYIFSREGYKMIQVNTTRPRLGEFLSKLRLHAVQSI